MVPGLFADVKTDPHLGPWKFEMNVVREKTLPGGVQATEILTNVTRIGPNGQVYHGKLRQTIARHPNASGGHDIELVTNTVVLQGIPPELRWVNEGGVPLQEGRGVPLQTYLALQQMKGQGIALGQLSKAKIETIVNARTCIELALLQRRSPGASPDKLIEQTQSGINGMTNVTQAGSKVKGMRIRGGSKISVNELVGGTELDNDAKLRELGISRSDEVMGGFNIEIDLEPAHVAGES
jgi:hypothetical protein